MIKITDNYMKNNPTNTRNWFDHGGQAYAAFRPQYPSEIASYLTSLVPETRLAVDVGCGTGQLTQLLAPYFDTVIGLDPSSDQIANTMQSKSISYQCSSAEHLPLNNGSVNLITAAQSAHWFDLPRFYNEVRRVASTDSILALISYGVLKLEPGINDRVQHFYWNEIGTFWPPERKLVDSGYATIDFPFTELAPPSMEIRLDWDLNEFMGYISTWSAIRNAIEIGREDLLQSFSNDITKVWGDANTKHPITWSINMRIGIL